MEFLFFLFFKAMKRRRMPTEGIQVRQWKGKWGNSLHSIEFINDIKKKANWVDIFKHTLLSIYMHRLNNFYIVYNSTPLCITMFLMEHQDERFMLSLFTHTSRLFKILFFVASHNRINLFHLLDYFIRAISATFNYARELWGKVINVINYQCAVMMI